MKAANRLIASLCLGLIILAKGKSEAAQITYCLELDVANNTIEIINGNDFQMKGLKLNKGSSQGIKLVEQFEGWGAFYPIYSQYTADRPKLEVLLKKLNHYSTEDLRQIMINIKPDKDINRAIEFWNLCLVINRYVFEVPKEGLRLSSKFGSFLSPTIGSAPGTWPLEISATGDIKVLSGLGAYSGKEYEYVQEFDYFLTTYGRRKFARTGEGSDKIVTDNKPRTMVPIIEFWD